MFQQILNNIKSFVSNVKAQPVQSLENEIQSAIVLTGDNILHWDTVLFSACLYDNCVAGVNVSDHTIMFERIISKLDSVTKHIAVIWSRNSNSIKDILGETIYQLINSVDEVSSLWNKYSKIAQKVYVIYETETTRRVTYRVRKVSVQCELWKLGIKSTANQMTLWS